MQSDSSPLPGYQGCRVDWQPSSARKVMLGADVVTAADDTRNADEVRTEM